MPTSFLDIPREIRDQIYDHVLISPTGYIEAIPVARYEKSGGGTGPRRFSLHVKEPHLFDKPFRRPRHVLLSLSLLRACHQIHVETKDLFWRNNTFHFTQADEVVKVLKSMGQLASRLITSISIQFNVSTPACTTSLAKALQLLASRARLGCFRRLEFKLGSLEYLKLTALRNGEFETDRYDSVLDTLRHVSATCKFDKVVEITLPFRWYDLEEESDKSGVVDTIREIHFAWGGLFFMNGMLLWKDYEEVGRS